MKRILLALMLAGLVACSGADPVPTTEADAGAVTTVSPGSESPLDERLAFVVGLFNGEPLSEAEYAGVFAEEFVDNVPYDELMGVVRQLSAVGEAWSIVDYEDRSDLTATVILAPASAEPTYRANIALESVVPFRIVGLLIQPTEPPTLDEPPPDLDSAASRLAEQGTLRLLAAEVTDSTCEPIFEVAATEPAPVGSVIKLYVLGAVAEAVSAGALEWSQDVEISEDLKSVPTGVLQHEEAGTAFSVREMAEAMIALSDNTATDHLIDRVGRDAVERALSRHGMEDPGLNIPFPSTLELTALKVGPAAGLGQQWIEAGEEGRRELLEQISDITPADLPLGEFDEPRAPDQIEWFASPADLCRLMSGLAAMGEPLTNIMSINPGVPDDSGRFDQIWFKGGSEPGLVAMSWLVERSDGRRYFLAGSVVDAHEDVDQLEVTLLLAAMRDLLADRE